MNAGFLRVAELVSKSWTKLQAGRKEWGLFLWEIGWGVSEKAAVDNKIFEQPRPSKKYE